MRKTILTFAVMFCVLMGHAQGRVVSPHDVDWSSFLGKHDFVWDSIPADYYAGAIMGNGLVGNNIYREGNALKFHIGRVDVTEGRMPADSTQYNALYHAARLPIGYFLLTPKGGSAQDMKLDLWNATTTGHFGGVGFKSYVHAVRPVIVLETAGDFDWTWQPLEAVSPRRAFGGYNDAPQDYLDHPNPAPRMLKEGSFNFSIQNLVGGKTYVVAWVRSGERILITITQEKTEKEAIAAAERELKGALRDKRFNEKHREWWHNFYPASHAAFGDQRLEAFYWRQQYKFGCLTRPDGHIIDLQGPWAVQKTPWPAIWYNLNIQLTYAPLVTANRAAMTLPVWRQLNANHANLRANARGKGMALGRSGAEDFYRVLQPEGDPMLYEVGNFTWLLYYYYEYCISTGVQKELLNDFYPLLKGAVEYYASIRERRADGLWHLPMTASPEYRAARDCNYDLSVLRWGLGTLLAMNEKYGLNDVSMPEWREFLENLTPYPVDPQRGFMIGEGVNLTESHRHYSHLLMIYPLHLVTDRELIMKSLDNWQSMPRWLQGYSFTGSAAIYAMMGDGERAARQMRTLLDKFIQPNTLYKETGPVIETPLTGAASLQDMLMQSWGGRIRIFPAVPWAEASFIDFRTAGAFLISARREGGRTVFVQVRSERGGECIVETGIPNPRVTRIGGGTASYTDLGNGTLKLEMRKGEAIVVRS